MPNLNGIMKKLQHRGYKACVGNGAGRIRANSNDVNRSDTAKRGDSPRFMFR